MKIKITKPSQKWVLILAWANVIMTVVDAVFTNIGLHAGYMDQNPHINNMAAIFGISVGAFLYLFMMVGGIVGLYEMSKKNNIWFWCVINFYLLRIVALIPILFTWARLLY